MSNILDLLADDQSMVTYRPNLRKITGSVTATILLQQILFRWKGQGKKPFYKFKEPCDHEKYKEGDSWAEELGFSRKEFDVALKKIGYKIGKNKSFKDKEKNEAFVWFRTDSNRMTWYEVNEPALLKAINELYRVTTKRDVSYSPKGTLEDKVPKGRYNPSENTTENTTENTYVKPKSKKKISDRETSDKETSEKEISDSETKEESLQKGVSLSPKGGLTKNFRPRARSGLRFTHAQYAKAMTRYEGLEDKVKDVVDAYVEHETLLSDTREDVEGLRKYFICEYMNQTKVAQYWKSMTPEQRQAELEASPQYRKKKKADYINSLDINDPNVNLLDLRYT